MPKTKLNDVGFTRHQRSQDIIINDDNMQKMKSLLDETGPGFCLAKWTQVTMHLGAGLTHSCHHPKVHKIPLEELKDNPGALHNTKFKKEQRKKMLNGERPSECDFCWRIEDCSKQISDRVLKSMDTFSVSDYDDISELTGDENVYPRYVEVSFGNVCNLKCSYCGPTFSSKWVEENNQHGIIKFEDGDQYNANNQYTQIKNREDNPYTDAFWKWWPEAVKHMHTFRITGGEPLLNKHTMRTLKFLLENPNPDLEVAVNSNGCPPDKIWIEFTSIVNKLLSTNSIKKFTLFVSAESVEEAAEFSRTGLDWNLFTSNIEYFIDNTVNTRVTFMAAFNIFSITTIGEFLEYVLYLKRKYNKSGLYKWMEERGVDIKPLLLDKTGTKYNNKDMVNDNQSDVDLRISVDLPYVRSPEFLDVRIVTTELLNKFLVPAVDYMYRNISNGEWQGAVGFEDWEALKLKRILIDCLIWQDLLNANDDHATSHQKNMSIHFYQFIQQYQKRRNVNFLNVFPEMKSFMSICEKEYNAKIKKKNES